MLIPDALDILKARLESIDGLTVTTNPAVTVIPPMALIDDTEANYNEAFKRGALDLDFTVTVFVSEADKAEGLNEARLYLSGHGAQSIRAALETEPTAGDDLSSPNRVTADVGARGESNNYITATFNCRAHIPNA